MKDLNKMTVGELEKHIETLKTKAVTKMKGTPFVLGKNYLIRTVTMIYTGKLTKVFDKELVIEDAAWIPETERWAGTVAKGIFKEVEPYKNEVIIGRGAILDITMVDWKLPREQK